MKNYYDYGWLSDIEVFSMGIYSLKEEKHGWYIETEENYMANGFVDTVFDKLRIDFNNNSIYYFTPNSVKGKFFHGDKIDSDVGKYLKDISTEFKGFQIRYRIYQCYRYKDINDKWVYNKINGKKEYVCYFFQGKKLRNRFYTKEQIVKQRTIKLQKLRNRLK